MNPVKAPTALIPEERGAITLDQLKVAMPKRQARNATQGMCDKLNKLVTEPEERELFRENLLGLSHILQDPNTKLDSYIYAVKFVSYKMMGMTNEKAWIKTFPDRYQRLMDSGKSHGHLRATVSGYWRSKIVSQVYEQAMIPVYIVNADVFQEAVTTQAQLMTDPKVSDKVRSDAANSLMTHLKPPEAKKLELDVAVKEDDSLRDLRRAVTDLAIAQKKTIESGGSTALDIAESRLINGESERID